jgi:hypothetical protein
MMMLLLEAIKAVMKSLMVGLITEKFLKEVIIYALTKLSEKTDNKVDDEVLAMVKKALHPEETKAE